MKLWNYIKGIRKGKDAHRLEKEAMSDPFLAHALRGFDKVKGDHAQHIDEIQKELRNRTVKKPNYLKATGIAASILIVFSVGTYYLVNQMEFPTQELAVFHEIKPDTIVPAPAPPESSLQEELAVVEDSGKPESIIQPVEFESQVSAIPEYQEPQISAELDEVEITGYATARKKELTGAVQGIRATTLKSPSIKGKVTDHQGEPIIGANVTIPGTNQGTVTDTDGYFELPTNDSTTLRIAYIGYEEIKIPADTGEVMHIALHEDRTTLDEVVVSGYGSKRKKEISTQESKPVNGKKHYNKYIKKNRIRPTDDECRDVKGKVILRFYVNQEGRPIQIIVEKSLCPSADQEAIRLLTEGPNWTSGTQSTTIEIKF